LLGFSFSFNFLPLRLTFSPYFSSPEGAVFSDGEQGLFIQGDLFQSTHFVLSEKSGAARILSQKKPGPQDFGRSEKTRAARIFG
jgi:hypothetical protein